MASPAAAHSPTLYTGAPSGRFVSPFSLDHDPMDMMVLYTFDGDPDYNTLELQLFNHPDKGTGAAALMARNDGLVDFYMTPGLRLDREKTQVGSGVGEWLTQDFECSIQLTPRGLEASAALTLKDGRPVRMVIRERIARPGKRLDILAPVGISIENPYFLPLFWLTDIDLVRVSGTEIDLSIGDRHYLPARLPMPMPHTFAFAYFVRACPDPLIITVNQRHDGPLDVVTPDAISGFAYRDMEHDLVERDGRYEIGRVAIRGGRHEVALRFAPAFPALLDLSDGAAASGRFTLGVDALPAVMAGRYEVRRSGQQVRVQMQPTESWKPHGTLRQRATIYLLPPMFRNWPKTYEWTADLHLANAAQGHVALVSNWRRIGA